MTENSSAAVGRVAIDAYLDSVELALIAADAPRIDRLQVLQDLESQIADMLAREPSPLSEESVRTVLHKLEPPSHFAATYGNGASPGSAAPAQPPTPTSKLARFSLPPIRWPIVAAGSCALLPIGCVVMLMAAAVRSEELIGLVFLGWFVGLVLTPIALWLACRQLRAQNGAAPGRDTVLRTSAVYGVIASGFAIWLACAMTDGAILFPLGVVAVIYVQYLLVRRLWRYLADHLPAHPSLSTNKGNGNGSDASLNAATPAPAM